MHAAYLVKQDGNMLLINPNDNAFVENFLESYKIWQHTQSLLGQSVPAVIGESSYGYPCFKYYDVELINACDQGIIIIDCAIEGLHSYNVFQQYRHDRHYVIFSNGTWDPSLADFGFSYDVIPTHFYIFELLHRYTNTRCVDYYWPHDYDFDHPKPYVFVSTTGNVRPDRDELARCVRSRLTFDDFVFRYSGEDLGQPSQHLDSVNFPVGGFDPYTTLSDTAFFTVSHTIPIDLYNSARFNLVVESDIALQNNFFLTEKTLKCLITGIPFVLVGSPLFLQNLQQLGLSTYNDIWDESYDLEPDYIKRIDKIMDLCNNLKHLDWDRHRSQLELIKHRNRSWFMSTGKLMDHIFRNIRITGIA